MKSRNLTKALLLPLMALMLSATGRAQQGDASCITPTPHAQDFESVSGTLPTCWMALQTSTYDSDNPYPRVRNNSANAHSGSQFLSLYEGTDSYQNRISNSVASPLFDNPASLMLSFWVKAESSQQTPSLFVVGLADELGTFFPIDTIDVTTQYEQHYVTFESYTGAGAARIAFLAAKDYAIYTSFLVDLDDIQVDRHTECPLPSHFRCTHVGAGEVTIGWDGEGASLWEVTYGPTGFQPSNTSDIVDGLTDPEAYFDWLSDTTSYDFYVRAVCDSATVSLWVGPVTARMGLYEMAVTGWDTLYACGMTITDDGGLNGHYSSGCDAYLVIFPEEPNYTVRLRGMVNTYSLAYDYVDLYEGVGVTGNSLGRYGGNDGMMVDTVSGVGAMTLHFRAAGQVTDWLRPYLCIGYALEVVCDEMADCPAPTGLAISNITGTTAYATWSPSASEGADYTLIVTDLAHDISTAYTNSSPYLLLGGLEPNTTYSVSLQASCPNGYVSDFVVDTFTTLCLSGGVAEVGSNEVSTYMIPFTPWYEYSMSQQIFLASELTQINDSVFGVSFYNTTPYTDTRHIAIYLQTTTLDSFSTALDYVAPTQAVEVFNGTVTLQPNGWCPITFSSTFYYPGSGNLLLTCYDNTGTYVDNTPRFAINNRGSNRSIYRYATSPIDVMGYPAGATADNMTTYTRFTTQCGTFMGCLPPLVHVDEVLPDEVTLSWVPGYHETAWSVEYMGQNDAGWTVATASTSTPVYTLTGLTDNTTYQIRVTSLCGGTAGTADATITVATPCTPIATLPYVQDFDHFSAPADSAHCQPCWTRLSNGVFNWHPYLSNTNAASGLYSLYFDATASPYLVMPPLDLGLDTVILTARVMSLYTAANNSVSVGVMTDPSNPATFIPVGTYTLQHASERWQEFEVSFEHYHGPHGQIAITCGAQCIAFFLDDLTLHRASSCHRVTNPQVATSATAATLSWTDTNAIGSYTLRWGTLDDPALATDSADVEGYSYTISSLAAGQRYYAWIRTNCDDEPSWWKSFDAFATACAPISTVPWTESFESYDQGEMPECWLVMHSHDDYPRVTRTTPAYSGSALLALDAYTYAAGGLCTVALPAIASTDGLQLRFAARTVAGMNPESFTAGYIDSLGRYVPVDTIELLDQWSVNYLYLDNYPIHSGRIAFQSRDTNVQGHGRVLLDAFELDTAASCRVPSRLRVLGTTDHSAGLTWHEEGSASQWQIAYSTQPLTDPSQGSLVLADSVPFRLSGLSPNTAYHFYLRAICAPGDTSFWTEPGRQASTTCSAIAMLPFTEDFEGNTMPSCWRQEHLVYENDWKFHRQGAALTADSPCTSSHGGSYNAAFLHDFSHNTEITSTRLLTPLFDLSEASEPTLSFWHAQPSLGDGSDELRLLYRSHPEQPWQTLAVYNSEYADWTQEVVTLPNPSEEYQLAFEGIDHYGYGLGLDDVQLYEIIILPCDPVASVNISVDDSAATLSWAAPATSPDGYLLEWGPEGFTPGQGTIRRLSQPADTLTGLTPNTTYHCYLLTLCADGADTSDLAGPFAFTTTIPCHTPSQLAITDLGGTSATLAWTPTSGESAWQVRYGSRGDTLTATASSPTLSLTSLTPGATYSTQVRALCGQDDIVSPWSDPLSFTTLICDTVTHLSIQPRATEATLSWTSDAQAWKVLYGLTNVSADMDSLVVTLPTCELTGLQPEMTYYVVVIAYCADDWNSVQTHPVGFNTTAQTAIDPAAAPAIRLHPNPARQQVTVEGYEGPLQVVDMTGRIVRSLVVGPHATPLSLDGLTPGAYFVKMGTTVKRLVVQ